MKACHKLQCLSSISSSKMAERLWRMSSALNSYRWFNVHVVADEISVDSMTEHSIITENLTMRKSKKGWNEQILSAKRRVNQVRPTITGTWKLHHDNAPSHTCSKITNYLAIMALQWFPNPASVPTWHQHTTSYSQKNINIGPQVQSKKLAHIPLRTFRYPPGSLRVVKKLLATVFRRSRDHYFEDFEAL